MDTGELLNTLGVSFPRQELYYLEAQGFLRPEKRRVGKTWRRDWPPEVIPTLRIYWKLHEEGFPPRVAWEKAEALARREKENQ